TRTRRTRASTWRTGPGACAPCISTTSWRMLGRRGPRRPPPRLPLGQGRAGGAGARSAVDFTRCVPAKEMVAMIKTRYLFTVAMDVEPGKDAVFNEVYDTEQARLILTLPGV